MKNQITVLQIPLLCLLAIGITAIVFLLFQHVDFFNGLNDQLLDQFILYTGERQPCENIVIIGIDDESGYRFRHLDLRSLYARLIHKLSSSGARTIVFDLLFQDDRNPEIDAQLAEATNSYGHVIHCFNFSEIPEAPYLQHEDYEKYAREITNNDAIEIINADYATFPNKRFIRSFNQAGFFNAKRDPDNQTRRIPLFMKFEEQIYSTLGLPAMLDFLDLTESTIEIEKSFWGYTVIIESADRILKIPVNSKGQVLLNFYGFLEQFDLYPLHRVIDFFGGENESETSSWLRTLFEGKIVIIGNTETTIDEYSTPFSSKFHGVGFHATLISNILKGDYITETSWRPNILISAMLSCLLLMAFFNYYSRSKSIWTFCSFSLILFLSFNIFSYFILFKLNWIWLKVLQIDGTFLILCISLTFYERAFRLKTLNAKIDQLEDDIFTKLTYLDSLDHKIGSQSEQYKLIQFFAEELHTILKDPSLKQQDSLEKYFKKFLENQEIIKEQLMKQLEQSKREKQDVEKEKDKLEFEKRFYEGLLKGEKKEVQVPIKEKPKEDNQQVAHDVMKSFQYFQLQQKKGSLQNSFLTFGIVALSNIVKENGETIKTSMGEIFEKINLMRGFDSNVLITGEHGTGKELIAKAIHEQSRRSNNKLVTLNCSAIPENLLESELFGHVKGAFTHAISDRKGAFECADGGTIFLDEIGDLKLDLQAKLLRVLQEREIQKVGSSKTIQVDIRVISATNKDLQKCIDNNEFRNDLYFRLNVVNLHIPPLRERRFDIPFLIQYFLDDLNSKYGTNKSFSDDAIIAAMCYNWPGNIRMLEHTVEKICVTTSKDVIYFDDLSDEIQTAYRNIFDSDEFPGWQKVIEMVHVRKQQMLELCKKAIKDNKINEFLESNSLKVNQQLQPNLYKYFRTFVNGLASIFSDDDKEKLVKEIIVDMLDQLLDWCREEKFAKLQSMYGSFEKILGRTRRQIDNWRKE